MFPWFLFDVFNRDVKREGKKQNRGKAGHLVKELKVAPQLKVVVDVRSGKDRLPALNFCMCLKCLGLGT